MQRSILVVEDEPVQREVTRSFVKNILGLNAICLDNGREAVDYIKGEVAPRPDLVMLDIEMPGINGMEVLKTIRPLRPELPIIMLTSHDETDRVIDAMRYGASDYIIKPFSHERMKITIQNMMRMGELSTEISRLQRTVSGAFTFSDLIGHSPAFLRSVDLGKRAADSDIPLLVLGESGVGKEMFARAVHGTSERSGKPFIAVNCGAIPENLVESILFGHEKGAFTGAVSNAVGKFREADGGTLFLDEIGELRQEHQVKLLRVLQEQEVQPVGAKDVVKVNVRIISATNRDLEQQVRAKTFREDLYYRLNVFPVTMPSLRARQEDIVPLAEYFITRFALSEGKAITGLTEEARQLLQSHHWPGNIRQLENTLFRAVVLCDRTILDAKDFPMLEHSTMQAVHDVGHGSEVHNDNSAAQYSPDVQHSIGIIGEDGHMLPMDEIEQRVISQALSHYKGHMSEVARRLGIGRSTLYRKLADKDTQASA